MPRQEQGASAPRLGPYLWPGRDFPNVMLPDPQSILSAFDQPLFASHEKPCSRPHRRVFFFRSVKPVIRSRNYVGATFAIERATNVLAAAAQRFDVELPPDVRLSW